MRAAGNIVWGRVHLATIHWRDGRARNEHHPSLFRQKVSFVLVFLRGMDSSCAAKLFGPFGVQECQETGMATSSLAAAVPTQRLHLTC